ncbi:hypothetical protein HDE_10381 [Halotydeus destructor]|nr:hypothetical protein HDE_10381 [Halotydeus destructor]
MFLSFDLTLKLLALVCTASHVVSLDGNAFTSKGSIRSSSPSLRTVRNSNSDIGLFEPRYGSDVEMMPEETQAQGTQVSGADLSTAAGHHHGHHGGHHGYFQYARVPHKDAWEFGFRRGNHGHFKERHEHGKGHHFKTKVRWGDKHGGYGEHFWDYNHHPKHHEHHGHHHGHKHHAAGAAAASAAVVS